MTKFAKRILINIDIVPPTLKTIQNPGVTRTLIDTELQAFGKLIYLLFKCFQITFINSKVFYLLTDTY